VEAIFLNGIDTTIDWRVGALEWLEGDEMEVVGEDVPVLLPLEEEEIESETTSVPQPLPTHTEASMRKCLILTLGASSSR
jgi:hypothetical protein